MPLPLTVSCFSKIQTGFTFLVPADLGSRGKRAVKRVCVCASVGGGSGFSSFDTEDQITIVRLGQSSSRVLVAALHWYDADRRTFRNFLSWRAGGAERGRTATGLDLFKQQLVRFSETVIALELDPVEAAMLNVLLVTASGMRTARAPP